MASLRMTLLDLLNKSKQGADPNFLRDGVQLLAQELMDAEVTDLVGAEPHQSTAGRTTYRNGYRDREWDTRVGTLELQIPKLRQGTYFPSLLEPRRRHERALLSVVQEAYIHGVSTRAVDNLAEALGIKSISKDQVSRLCKELDAQVHAFRTRRLDGEFPYLFLDATFEKVRENGRVISMAVLIAVGVRSTGEREVVGIDVGPAEDHEFWLQFLRQLVSRGLSEVRLVISNSHLGLKQAVAKVFVGASWQRCRVHFMRNALATVPKVAQQMVAAALRTVFAQPDQASAHDTVERICRLFEKRYPQLVKVVQEAEVDVRAYFSFPVEHRRQIWSTNSLERLNKEVSRRCDVVGIFPNRASLLRLTGAVLEEQNDECLSTLASVAAIAVDDAAMHRRLHIGDLAEPAPKKRSPAPDLSRLEQQIMRVAVEGRTNRQISAEVNLSQNTIKFHIRQILQRAGVANRTELAHEATREGWI